MSDLLRIGIVGVNGIGNWHLYALQQAERSVTTAVCDIVGARAEKAGARNSVPAFTDVPAMCESGEIDAVVVATPAGTHRQIVMDALDAGMHVYCEKPIAPTADDGYALARHAHDVQRTLQVGFQFRFHAGYAAARDHVRTLGNLSRVNLTATNWFRAQAYFEKSPWRATWSMAGGGVLMNQAIHQLDAMIATAGMPSSVRGRVRRTRHRAEVEDDAVAMLEWTSGATGVLIASLADPAGHERLEFWGERGALVLADGYTLAATEHEDAQKLCDECPDEFPELTSVWKPIEVERAATEWIDCLVEAHRAFATAVFDAGAPVVDGESGTRSVELANAIYLSSVEDRTVALPLERGEYTPVFEELVTGGLTL